MRVLWLTLLSCVLACDARDPGIVLGPLPDRPVDRRDDDDAGPVRPAGSVPCDDATQCDDEVDCTRDECLAPGYCAHLLSHERCSDGVYCNGVELCDARRGCLPAQAPRCSDGDACTVDRCDEVAKGCVSAPRDFDHDREVDSHCPGGTDCDDFDETRGTRIAEVCANRIDDDCDERVDEADCGRAVHDKCDDALDMGSGGTFTLDLSGAAPDYAFSCDPDASRDVVLSFELPRAQDVTLRAHGVLADGDDEIASLVLQSSCGDAAGELECRRGFPSTLRARALPAGRYFVVATSYAAASLVVSLELERASAVPSNTRCDAALDVSAAGRFEGDFVDVASSSEGCGPEASPDLYYAFTLTEPHDVELLATADDGSPLALRIDDGCGKSATPLVCDAESPAQTRLHSLAAGDYRVIVSGPPSHEVSFALDLAISAPTPEPAGDRCDDALVLELDEKQQVVLADKRDDVDASCQRFGSDAVLQLRVPRAMDLRMQLDAGAVVASMSLQRECGQPQTELSCRAGAPLSTRVRGVARGTYFVVIDAPGAASATLLATPLATTQAVAVDGNETCASAFDVPADGGVFVGDTSGARDDFGAACGGGARSPDVVYRLVLDAPQHVEASVDAAFDSVLYRAQDERAGDEACSDISVAACDDDSGRGAQAELSEELEAGTHYYFVDGFKTGNAGSYVLDIVVSAPVKQ